MPVHGRLTLTQNVLGKPIPRSLVLAVAVQTRGIDVLLDYSVLHLDFVSEPRGCLVHIGHLIVYVQQAQIGV